MPRRTLLRSSWKALFALILGIGGGSRAQAQQAPAPVALSGTEQHDLASGVNGQKYRLYVALPDGYDPEGGTRYPVLYLLDGYFAFPAAVTALGGMAIQRELEDVIVVGIGDGEHAFDSWFVNRWRDYTPSLNAAADSAGASSFGIPAGRVSSGGAPAFLRVLREEILPFVEATYRTSGDRGIAGHSFGGLFAAWVLLEAPDLFRRYGINSPSLWWNGGEMFEREADRAARNGVLAAHVFLSVGSLEGRMVPSMERFAAALRSRGDAGLAVDVVVFEGETHGSVGAAMVARTLRVLYASRPGR
jgi:predicted alpha/beta superfamily hydrolase